MKNKKKKMKKKKKKDAPRNTRKLREKCGELRRAQLAERRTRRADKLDGHGRAVLGELREAAALVGLQRSGWVWCGGREGDQVVWVEGDVQYVKPTNIRKVGTNPYFRRAQSSNLRRGVVKCLSSMCFYQVFLGQLQEGKLAVAESPQESAVVYFPPLEGVECFSGAGGIAPLIST